MKKKARMVETKGGEGRRRKKEKEGYEGGRWATKLTEHTLFTRLLFSSMAHEKRLLTASIECTP
jgi:hypothetical protein